MVGYRIGLPYLLLTYPCVPALRTNFTLHERLLSHPILTICAARV
jgi:hypothetical protein